MCPRIPFPVLPRVLVGHNRNVCGCEAGVSAVPCALQVGIGAWHYCTFAPLSPGARPAQPRSFTENPRGITVHALRQRSSTRKGHPAGHLPHGGGSRETHGLDCLLGPLSHQAQVPRRPLVIAALTPSVRREPRIDCSPSSSRTGPALQSPPHVTQEAASVPDPKSCILSKLVSPATHTAFS